MPNEPPTKEHFQEFYAGKAPWDIGKPQPALVAIADQITGDVLDAGCGTGENALYFAERGRNVVGVDFVEAAIARANRKAEDRSLTATFRVADALALSDLPERFDSVIDCGLFHTFEDEDRALYVKELASVVKPNGRLFMLCFSDEEPPGDGPRRVTRQDIKNAFADGWQVESIEKSRFDTRPDLADIHFSPGGPIAWLSVIQRIS